MYSHIMMLAANAVTSIDRSVPMSERLLMGTKTLLLGMGIVMFILALLWGILELFKVFFYDIPNKRDKKTQDEPEIEDMPAPAEPVPDYTDDTSDDEIIAAITAAITAYRDIESDSEYTGGFRVVSFKKQKNAPAVRKN
ncbi:MAG: OadG family protein [Eubacteriales bacterium]